jgi:hypothetical protein
VAEYITHIALFVFVSFFWGMLFALEVKFSWGRYVALRDEADDVVNRKEKDIKRLSKELSEARTAIKKAANVQRVLDESVWSEYCDRIEAAYAALEQDRNSLRERSNKFYTLLQDQGIDKNLLRFLAAQAGATPKPAVTPAPVTSVPEEPEWLSSGY